MISWAAWMRSHRRSANALCSSPARARSAQSSSELNVVGAIVTRPLSVQGFGGNVSEFFVEHEALLRRAVHAPAAEEPVLLRADERRADERRPARELGTRRLMEVPEEGVAQRVP